MVNRVFTEAAVVCVLIGDTVECSGAQAARIKTRGALRDKIRGTFHYAMHSKIKAQITLDDFPFF
jgi:hypothetical protein